MSTIQFKNHYPAELEEDLGASDTQIVLKSGHGANFPEVASAEEKHFFVTLVNAAGAKEIIKIIQRASGSDTLVVGDSVADQPSGSTAGRAQEGTSALAVAAADDHVIELRLTAGIMTALVADIEALEAWADATDTAFATIEGEFDFHKSAFGAITTGWSDDSVANLKLASDVISEKTSAAGVTVDGVLLKDSEVTTDVIKEKTGAAGVTVDGCLIKDGVAAAATKHGELKVKVVEIGDWNMDSADDKAVVHGLTLAKIRSVSAVIRNDDDSVYYGASFAYGNTNPLLPVCIMYLSATSVHLAREASNFFDAVDFNSTTYNRGWITIWYVD